MMVPFKTSEGAHVTYDRDNVGVLLNCDSWYFTRKGWDELTAVLFPLPPVYAIDGDVWLP